MRQAPLAEAPHRERREVRLIRADAPLKDGPDPSARAGHRAHSLAAAEAVLDNLEPPRRPARCAFPARVDPSGFGALYARKSPARARGVTRRRGRRRRDRPKQQTEPLLPRRSSLGRESPAFLQAKRCATSSDGTARAAPGRSSCHSPFFRPCAAMLIAAASCARRGTASGGTSSLGTEPSTRVQTLSVR